LNEDNDTLQGPDTGPQIDPVGPEAEPEAPSGAGDPEALKLAPEQVAQLLSKFSAILDTSVKSPVTQRALKAAFKMAPQEMFEFLSQVAGAGAGMATRMGTAMGKLGTPVNA
jgi:hypothetical protein